VMQRMNAEVVIDHQTPAAVAHKFLASRLK
jgi:glycine betaine/choline ABC-type transport system substrate-binding protein